MKLRKRKGQMPNKLNHVDKRLTDSRRRGRLGVMLWRLSKGWRWLVVDELENIFADGISNTERQARAAARAAKEKLK